MTVTDALNLNGHWVCLMLSMDGEELTITGQVVGVVVPAPGLGVDGHLLVRQGREVVSPCGGGLEVFLCDVVTVVWWGDAPLEQKVPPALRLV